MPYLFFVLWDYEPTTNTERVRIWTVSPQKDNLFREMCLNWYSQRTRNQIISYNFQLHPPANHNSDVFTNRCGNLKYPLLFEAIWTGVTYKITHYDADVLISGYCTEA